MTMESINESKFPLDRVVGIGVAMPGLIERGNIALQDELKKRKSRPGYRRDKKYTAKLYCRG